MRRKIKIAILKALHACDGEPMPEDALYSAACIGCKPSEPTRGDFADGLKEAEAEGYCAGATDDLTGPTWTLTTKGTHRARQLK